MKRCTLLFVAGLICLLVASAANAVGWTENFDSYANQAALTAVWTTTAGSGVALVTDQVKSAPNAAYQGTTAASSKRSIGSSIKTSVLSFKFDFYDGAGTSADGRAYGMVYAYDSANALTQIMAIGKYNGAVSSKYWARVAFGGINWFTLDLAADRSVGWHTAEIKGKSDGTVDFIIDGVVGANKTVSAFDFKEVRLGSGLSSNSGIWFDDVSITAIPEPGSMLALGTGLIGLFGILRRRSA